MIKSFETGGRTNRWMQNERLRWPVLSWLTQINSHHGWYTLPTVQTGRLKTISKFCINDIPKMFSRPYIEMHGIIVSWRHVRHWIKQQRLTEHPGSAYRKRFSHYYPSVRGIRLPPGGFLTQRARNVVFWCFFIIRLGWFETQRHWCDYYVDLWCSVRPVTLNAPV